MLDRMRVAWWFVEETSVPVPSSSRLMKSTSGQQFGGHNEETIYPSIYTSSGIHTLSTPSDQ
ncbi:hypothetical protein T265_04613 [Opisthorchis viverrini]|uniref:Uncharacterized protein n=1 Tax=Opisthorchis viverrini TaxID=6198 RepID=A0A074ZMF1_OPIVI|nr:hypothetical protein T265_04613 [Opisthorchis viverrini]KER28568.1 hypothetical protein T265_04613 [Opisthorchis viverrini]